MNFGELKQEVLDHGFDTNVYATRVGRWLNEAQARVARFVDIRDLYASASVSTVGGTATYSLPEDVIRIRGVVDAANGGYLRYASNADRLLAANENGSASGRPETYGLNNSGLLLYPTPDIAYDLTLIYYKRPDDLEADNDESILPADYHDVLVSYALSRAYRAEDDMQMSQFHYAEYQRDLALLGNDRQFESMDGPRQVPGTWDDW